jgi:hypothetical protein
VQRLSHTSQLFGLRQRLLMSAAGAIARTPSLHVLLLLLLLLLP